MKTVPTYNSNENRKLQNNKHIITQFIQEDSYANICECVLK